MCVCVCVCVCPCVCVRVSASVCVECVECVDFPIDEEKSTESPAGRKMLQTVKRFHYCSVP